MAFSAKDVVALRAKTGCGMMDCKKALVASNGNLDKAIDFLREKGLAAAVKKAGRIAAEGVSYAVTNEAGTAGVVIEVNSETDFVAKNALFRDFVKTCAGTVLACKPADVDALLKCKAVGSDETVDALLKKIILKIGENIKIRRFQLLEGTIGAYIHADGKIGVITSFDTTPEIAAKPEFKEYAKNICMQVAAISPQYLDESKVPADVVAHEKEILKQQVLDSGKPAAIAEKIVNGRLHKFYEEVCLVDQAFIKEDKISVKQYTAQVAKELGSTIQITGFARYECGEGIEKRKEDFADEIKKLVK
jgi:elongation factor Ts